jgi:hypothetical protein
MSRELKNWKLEKQDIKSIPNDPFRCVKPNTPTFKSPDAGLGLPNKPHPFNSQRKEKP